MWYVAIYIDFNLRLYLFLREASVYTDISCYTQIPKSLIPILPGTQKHRERWVETGLLPRRRVQYIFFFKNFFKFILNICMSPISVWVMQALLRLLFILKILDFQRR
ncbi:hypothetical protein RchiOBHm_Chr1g0344121 [Rosa chinensis]|uniref:Uncharacterized protein n=1 Tax=Rosa chinensis TaxID=74649 RepID=A0A2P6SEF5_ROSCH|nr:hypothetical protein RchiOBHm_Chr1g0344121 [Rosa chinensis]